MTESEDDLFDGEKEYLANEERMFLQPLAIVERWTVAARLLHESYKGLPEAKEAQRWHVTREQVQDKIRDARGEDLDDRTISRLLTSFAVSLRKQEAARNGESARAARTKAGKFKHPELPRDSHGGYYLRHDQNPVPVLFLSDEEAPALLFALRYLLHNAAEQQPALISLLEQLASHFSGVLAAVARKTIEQAREIDSRKASSHHQLGYEVLNALTGAWLKREMVWLSYRSPWPVEERDWEPANFRDGCFQPVLLEPSRANGATYAVGWLITKGPAKLTTLKLDRIFQVQRHPPNCWKQHDPPQGDEQRAKEEAAFWVDDLDESWSGVLTGEETFRIEVRFSGDAAIRMRETPWRKSVQLSEIAADGSRTMVGEFTHYVDMIPWVLGWGSGAEVISPPELREEVARRLRAAAATYD